MSLGKRPGARSVELSLHLKIQIRPCVPADLPKLEWFGLYTDQRALATRALQRRRKGENMMLVADLRGFPVGQLWIDLAVRAPQPIGVLWALRVFPLLRGGGVGTQLIQAGERLLTAKGFSEAELGVEKANPRPRRLYERLGYRHIGDACEEYGYLTSDGREVREVADQWILRKPLSAARTRGWSARDLFA